MYPFINSVTMERILLLAVLVIIASAQAVPKKPINVPTIIEELRARDAQSRIVGGWEADYGQVPHQASVRMVSRQGGVSSCGGSLIHHNWIITAAHCVANRETFVVRLGVINVTRPEWIVETTHQHMHPGYNLEHAGVQTHDIALLRLDQHIPYGFTIQPCRLQSSDQKNKNYEGVRLIVSGFGLTDDPWNGGAASEVLLWVHLRGISNEDCKKWYNNTPAIQQQTVCAGYYDEFSQSACQGDSGGPLTMLDVDLRPTMVGIVSFGSSAGCNSRYPTAFVRPGHYHDWIQEITGMDFDWDSEDLEPWGK